jgi:glycosyltransferase involved in cell wall biosynthesis
VRNIVEQARKFCSSVIVINDGSQDRTREEAEKAGAIVIDHIINLGVGAALETAFQVASYMNADVVVSLDADAQHDPAEISKLVQPILNGEADFVIGSRFLGGADEMPLMKKIGNRILSSLTSSLCGYKITDSQSGYRAYSYPVIRVIEAVPKDYFWASETIIQIAKHNFKVKEVPIKTIYNKNLSRMKGTGILTGIEIFFRLIKSKLS